MVQTQPIDQLSVNTVRALSLDMVENAQSGHPGTPLGIAPVMYVLFDRVMRYSPRDPQWPARDRFVLSAGHACEALYASLFLSGYDVSMDDLKGFRQWGSRTAGHPEAMELPGVEVTTGPLGQGIGMAVGEAIAQRMIASRFHQPGFELMDHHVYAICSDGDMMEGISHEVASLAGALRLGRLIVIYDRNRVTIDGSTDITFSEDVPARFRAYGWNVHEGIDANDIDGLERALNAAKAETSKPSLIVQDSAIGFASPLEGSHKAHDKPMGREAVDETKRRLDYPSLEPFFVPGDVLTHMAKAVQRGEVMHRQWQALHEGYAEQFPEQGEEFEQTVIAGDLPLGWDLGWPDFDPGDEVATREASGQVIEAIGAAAPNFVGGAGDLGNSVRTMVEGGGDFSAEDHLGRNIWFGVREHAMGAIANGMAMHGGLRPYTGTFLTFSDYMKPAIRIAALMQSRVVHIFSHDSLGLGEDGPTHQPVEQLAGLRAIPKYRVIRPADATETLVAWRTALEHDGPTALVLSRQGLPVLDRNRLASAEGLRRGAYVLWQSGERPRLVLIATGSEVSLAMEAARRMADDGVAVRVVSMPSWELFRQQSPEYREEVLPRRVLARVSIEAGSPLGWAEWTGIAGKHVAVDRFGASAKGELVLKNYGFNVDNVVDVAREALRSADEWSAVLSR